MTGNTQRKNFKRVILKLSGEALREPGSEDNISPEIVEAVASQIRLAQNSNNYHYDCVKDSWCWSSVSALN